MQALNSNPQGVPLHCREFQGKGVGRRHPRNSVGYFLKEGQTRNKVSMPWVNTGAFALLSLSAGWAGDSHEQ